MLPDAATLTFAGAVPAGAEPSSALLTLSTSVKATAAPMAAPPFPPVVVDMPFVVVAAAEVATALPSASEMPPAFAIAVTLSGPPALTPTVEGTVAWTLLLVKSSPIAAATEMLFSVVAAMLPDVAAGVASLP